MLGPTLFDIPLEELFFFVIQTYNTTLLYLLLSKPTFHPLYLKVERSRKDERGALNEQWRYYKLAGQVVLGICIRTGLKMVGRGKEEMYMGMIIVWAGPFLLLLWYASLWCWPHMRANKKQESCISVSHWAALDEHCTAHCAAYVVPMDCRYASIEEGYLGY